MRIIIAMVLVLLVAGVVLALAVGGETDQNADLETVAAGFYPLAFAAQEIGGDAVEVENLTPPGVEPHDLEPRPDDVQRLQSADLVLLLGNDFQPSLEKAADGAGGRVLEVLDTPGLHPDPGDPHVWLDPVRYRAVVQAVGRAMGDEPATQRLIARLKALDREFASGLAHCRHRSIVTSHEAFGYLADRYGLTQVSISGVSPEAEPTPRDIQHVVDVVRETQAATIFTEPLVSPRLAESVALEAGAKTALLDPIEGLTPAEQASGYDYFDLMRRNLAALERGLGCRS